MKLQTGQIIDGKYRIVRELGSGAMGAVYEGENLRIRRRVAIKVLLPAVAQSTDTVQRFEREAQAAGRIGSEHIVEVLDLGMVPDGGLYLVMEFLEGMTLGQRIRTRGRLSPREIVPVVQQLLTGLEAAHAAGIVHRDLKPDNVFLCADRAGQHDFVKILDFGVSKFSPLSTEAAMSMTRTGAVVGTPFYMAPEQAKGSREVDHRSDLYSVGVILYQAVTGQVPFHAETFNELIFKIVLQPPAPPETYVPDLDPSFSRLVRRAMARDPNERYASAAELRDALSVWLHTGSTRGSVYPPAPPPVDAAGPDEDGMATVLADRGWDQEEGKATMIAEPRPVAFGPVGLMGSLTPGRGVPRAGEEEMWPVAGLPRPLGRHRATVVALVVGSVATLAIGAAAAVLVLGPGRGKEPDATRAVAATAAAAEELPVAATRNEAAQHPEAQGSGDQAPTAETSPDRPGAAPSATPAAAPRPAARPRPAAGTATGSPPAPKPAVPPPAPTALADKPPGAAPPAGSKRPPGGRRLPTGL